MKSLFQLLLCLASLAAHAQTIEQLSIETTGYPNSVHAEGWMGDTGWYITRTHSYPLNDSTVALDIYWKHCPGFTMITPYETTIPLDYAHPVVFDLLVTTLRDTVPEMDPDVDPDYCYPNDTIDTMAVYYVPAETLQTTDWLQQQLTVFPNPASEAMTVSSPQIPVTGIVLYDMQGRKAVTLPAGQISIDVSELPSGVYVLDITTPYGSVYKKVLVDE